MNPIVETKTLWTDTIEANLSEIKHSCKSYKDMNLHAMRRTQRIYDVLMYTIITVSPVIGIIVTISDSFSVRVVISVFAFVNSVLSSVVKFSKLEEKLSHHRSFAAKFLSLESNIKRQLSLQRSERVDAKLYLDITAKSFEELFTNMPIITESLYNKYVKNEILSAKPIPSGSEVVIPVSSERKPSEPLSPRHTGEFPISSRPELHTFSDDRLRYEMERLNRHV